MIILPPSDLRLNKYRVRFLWKCWSPDSNLFLKFVSWITFILNVICAICFCIVWQSTSQLSIERSMFRTVWCRPPDWLQCWTKGEEFHAVGGCCPFARDECIHPHTEARGKTFRQVINTSFFLIFVHIACRSVVNPYKRWRIRICEVQKCTDPTDPEPQHWLAEY